MTKSLALATAVLEGLCITVCPVSAQSWPQTSAPHIAWRAIASSADGAKLVAVVDDGGIYTSTNAGATWASNNVPKDYWSAVASSADGATLVALANSGTVQISRNFGSTWTSNSVPEAYWGSVAASADGNRLVASSSAFENSSPIYISTDSGVTWMPTSAPTNYWTTVASSADGLKLFASGAPGLIISTNAGATWQANPLYGGGGVACSADGERIVTTGAPYIIGLSTNYGATWISVPAPMAYSSCLASSADGTTLASAYNGFEEPAYTSTNSGATWVTNDTPVGYWESVVCSADGHKMAAAMAGGPICTSESTPAPSLHAVLSNDGFAVVWTIPSMNFVLQQNSDLTTTNWTEVTNTPTMNCTSLQNQLSVSPRGNRFYRLISQ